MKESTLLTGTAEALRLMATPLGGTVEVLQSPGELHALLRAAFRTWRIIINTGEIEGRLQRGGATLTAVEVTVQQQRGWELPGTGAAEAGRLEFCDRLDLIKQWMRQIRFVAPDGTPHPRVSCDGYTFVRESALELEDDAGKGLLGSYQRMISFSIERALPWITEELAVKLPIE